MPSAIELSEIAILRKFLINSPIITNQVSQRVYGPPGIPDTEVDNMPRKNIVIMPDGGERVIYEPLVRAVIQVRCYGATAVDADTVSRSVYQLCQRAGATTVTLNSSTYNILAIHRIGQPIYLTEPDAGWPTFISRYRMIAYEIAVS